MFSPDCVFDASLAPPTGPGLLSSQARQPLLQNCLAGWLNFGEGNSHPGVRLEVDHLAECGEACAAMRNSQ